MALSNQPKEGGIRGALNRHPLLVGLVAVLIIGAAIYLIYQSQHEMTPEEAQMKQKEAMLHRQGAGGGGGGGGADQSGASGTAAAVRDAAAGAAATTQPATQPSGG